MMKATYRGNVLQLDASACEEAPLAGELFPLVKIMLGVIARCHGALLQEDAETLHVIRGTLTNLCGPESLTSASGAAWSVVQSELARLLARVLIDPAQACSERDLLGPAVSAATALAPASWRNLPHQDELAHWFHRLSMSLHEAHPRAVEMLQLRLSGLGSREIAARLNLPFRLVQSVLVKIRSRALELEHAQEPSA